MAPAPVTAISVMPRGISGTSSTDISAGDNGNTANHDSFMRLLAESDSLDGCVCHPDYMEYRQKYQQWRTGGSQGARGEVSDIEIAKAKQQLPVDNPNAMVRCGSWPTFPLPRTNSDRNIWLFSEEMNSELHVRFPFLWHWLQSQMGKALQVVILVLVVFTYAACPLTVSWAKVVGMGEGVDPAHPVPIKGRPFKESSVIFVSWLMIGATGLVLSACIGGRKDVVRCLDTRSMVKFAPAGVGWALADVCEVLAVARIDPATYGVISQARLLGSAAACRAIRGMRQTQLQWGVLCVLSLVCMAYCLVPDGEKVHNHERLVRWRLAHNRFQVDWFFQVSRPSDTPASDDDAGRSDYTLGVVLALTKVTLSVLSGVYGETCFKHKGGAGSAPPPELHVQMTQVSFSSAMAALIGYLVLCCTQGENPAEFFSGPDGTWTLRTVVVAVVYCWREWICNLCVKRFDSLVKNICNAVALVVTYGFTVVVTGEKPFSLLKVLLLLAVVAEVVNYAETRRAPSVAQPQAAKEDEKGSNGDAHPAVSKNSIPCGEYSALSQRKAHSPGAAAAFEMKEL